jgi:hypothetical protein
MAMATDKRDVLERKRKAGQMRTLVAMLALGCLLGAGIAQVVSFALRTPSNGGPRDSVAPAILAVDPAEGTYLTAGARPFRVAFGEVLAANPRVLLAGPVNVTASNESFDGTTWRGTFVIPEGADGPYGLRVDGVRDAAGNERAPIAIPYAVDTTPPTSRASVPVNATDQPFDISWDATDGGSGIARVDLWIREGDPWTLLVSSAEPRGTYRWDPGDRRATFDIRARAADRTGNEEAAKDLEATVAYDASPPSAAIAPSSDYWHRQDLNLAAVAGPDVISVELRFYFAADNATWQGPFAAGNDTAPFAWTFSFPLGPGHYRIFGRAASADGTRERDQVPAAAEVLAGYDAELPASRLGDASPYWRAAPVTVSANASDDRSGIASVDLLYAHRPNGTAAWSPWTAAGSRAEAPWTFPFDFPRGDGRYELAVRARDRAGGVELLPITGQGDLGLGFDRDPPSAPSLALPRYVDVGALRTNITWTVTPSADLVRFEVHAGATPDFSPDGAPCASSSTCLLDLGRDARGAWAPLPAENATVWLRVRAVDDGGLAADSAAVGANGHGLGFDSPNTYAAATALPVNIAWSERIQYTSGCVDCSDVFKVTLALGDVLALSLAVPATGDFRIVVYNAAITVVAQSQTAGLGVWESLAYEPLSAGVYYVVVDWSNVYGPGNRNQGWYTLSAIVA